MLHCIFLGVVKALLHLWFDKSHRNEHCSLYSEVWKCSLYMDSIIIHAFTFGCYHKMQTCYKRLQSIFVPNTISRPPSPLENIACWKGIVHRLQLWMILFLTGSELQSWLLYYSIPVLQGIMLPNYFEHYSLLVSSTAVFIFC